jgi:hypothetical protein
MNTRTTLVLIVIVAALAGVIFFYESQTPRSWQAADRAQYLLVFDKNRVEGIEIVSNEDKVTLHRSGTKWLMDSPVKDRANPSAIAQILAKCETLAKEPVAGCRNADKKQLKNFGLTKASIRLKLMGRGMPSELLLGKDTAVDGKIYARLEGSNVVSVVSAELRTLITRKPDELRDSKLADFASKEVRKFSVKTLVGDVDFSRDTTAWSINKPIRARADAAHVASFLDSVLNTQVRAFLPENKGNLNSYGLSEPRGGVTFQLLGQAQPIALELGARDEKSGGVYARFSNRGGVCLLPRESENILNLAPNALRDRSLFRINLDVVDLITIAPAGKPAIRLKRAQEDWVVSKIEVGQASLTPSVPANKVKILQTVADLQSRNVSEFVADVASDLAKYGLDQPQLRVTFSSYSSENTAETQAGEHPLLTLAFGKREGAVVYARVENEPFVVSVPASCLDVLATQWSSWRQPIVFRMRPEEIASITVTPYSAGLPGTACALRAEADNWTTREAMQGIVNRNAVLKVVNTLGHITGQQWTDEEGPLVPALVIEFTNAGQKTNRLTLGAPAEDGSCLAAFQGLPGIFQLNAADSAVLRARLIDPVTPSVKP